MKFSLYERKRSVSGQLDNPNEKYLRRPDFPSTSIEFNNLKAYIQMSSKQVVEAITCEGDLGKHSEAWITLAKEVEGKELAQIFEQFEMELDDSETSPEFFLPLPSYLLGRLIQEYIGIHPTHCEAKDISSDSLICRCFGVYRDEVLSFLKNRPEAKLVDVNGELLAGSGCTNCMEDLEDLIKNDRLKKGFALVRGKLRYRPAGMTSAEFVLELDQFLKRLLPDREIEIIEFKEGVLEIKISGTNDNIKERVEGPIFEYYGTQLKIKLSVSE